MIKLREISNLVNFRTYVKEELIEIENELSPLKPIYVRLLESKNSDEIQEGSRVTFDRGHGRPVDGRVIAISGGKYAVHRDGFAGTINARKNELKNLSIGPAAELERQIWVLENRKFKISGHLKDAEIPELLLTHKYNFIQVIEIHPNYPDAVGSYQIITFRSSTNEVSYKLKVPTGIIRENGYYQIEMEDGDIKAVLKSTKENFER